MNSNIYVILYTLYYTILYYNLLRYDKIYLINHITDIIILIIIIMLTFCNSVVCNLQKLPTTAINSTVDDNFYNYFPREWWSHNSVISTNVSSNVSDTNCVDRNGIRTQQGGTAAEYAASHRMMAWLLVMAGNREGRNFRIVGLYSRPGCTMLSYCVR